MIPKNITREHLLAAITQIREEGVPARQHATMYNLEYEGEYFPPKLVVRKANLIANGTELWDFGGGPETNNFLKDRAFNVISSNNKTDLASALRHAFQRIWHCADSGQWELICENSLLSFDRFDPGRDYRQYPVTDGDGKKTINPWVKELKAGDLIFILDKYRYYGIAIAASEYDADGPFLNVEGRKWPAIRVNFLHKASKEVIFQFSNLNRPSTFSKIDASGFTLEKTLEILSVNQPDAIDALADFLELSGVFQPPSQNRKTMQDKSLNTILYGPPGTGKTYNAVRKALEILGEKDLEWEDRKAVKERFDTRVQEGRIVFTTFHQSMSYEDFIEGIKPDLIGEEEAKGLSYHIEDGIFKRLVVHAKYAYVAKNGRTNSLQPLTQEDHFRIAYDAFVTNFRENLLKGEQIELKTKSNLIVEVIEITERNNIKLQHQGSIRNNEYIVSRNRLLQLFLHIPNLNTVSNIDKQFRALIGGANATLYWAVLNRFMEDFEKNKSEAVRDSEIKLFDYDQISEVTQTLSITKELLETTSATPFVLIIDEINRGNISQIFGELITLIEPDKRLGNDEALTVTLPYSKESFGVPPNLYIIGTMNTADRSVEALDTALRRRFSFEEIAPDPALLSPGQMVWNLLLAYEKHDWDDETYAKKEAEVLKFLGAKPVVKENLEKYWDKYVADKTQPKASFDDTWFSGTTLGNLLKTINNRIEKLLDSDHQIGHSYILKVGTLDDLQRVFYHNVIPLLQEYFFGDYGKIGLVLGSGFVRKKAWNDQTGGSFAEFDGYENEGNFDDREVFEIVHYPQPDYELEIQKKKYTMDFEKAIQLLLKRPLE